MDAAAYVVWQVLVGGTAVTAAMAVMLVLPAPSNEIREFVTSKTSAVLRIHKVRTSPVINQSGLVHTGVLAVAPLPLHPLRLSLVHTPLCRCSPPTSTRTQA